MKRWVRFHLCMLVVFLSLLCIACSKLNESKESVAPETRASKPEVLIQDTSEDAETNLVEIETKYGVLYFPEEWQDVLVTEEEETEGIYTMYFSSQAEDETIPLFKVMICSEEGDSVGTVTDSEGMQRNVFVDITDLGDLSEYDEETQNNLYAMQEAVNVLMENLE